MICHTIAIVVAERVSLYDQQPRLVWETHTVTCF